MYVYMYVCMRKCLENLDKKIRCIIKGIENQNALNLQVKGLAYRQFHEEGNYLTTSNLIVMKQQRVFEQGGKPLNALNVISLLPF